MCADFLNPVRVGVGTAPNIANEAFSHISIFAAVKGEICILVEQFFRLGKSAFGFLEVGLGKLIQESSFERRNIHINEHV